VRDEPLPRALPRAGVAAVFDSAAMQSVNVERGAALLGDGAAFLVVGVVGRLGVGKSTLASALCGSGVPAFALRSLEHVIEARHCTEGVDMFVSADRVIVLDTQPILAATLGNGAAGTEQRMLAWLLAVCHIVVVVSGTSSGVCCSPAAPAASAPVAAEASPAKAGERGARQAAWQQQAIPRAAPSSSEYVYFGAGQAGATWQAMRVALMLKRGLPCVSVLDKLSSEERQPLDVAKHPAERCATAVFAFSKLPFATIEDWRLARHAHGIDVVANAIAMTFKHTDLLPGSVPAREFEHFADAHDSAPNSGAGSTDGVLYVMLPRQPKEARDADRVAYNDAIDVFRATVLSAPRRRFVNAAITEREWWRNAALAWQLLAQTKVAKELAKLCTTQPQR
jgi:hypothetical protein